MSWEVISVETTPCSCGAGTVETTSESDDWGRFRDSSVINCLTCRAARDEVIAIREQNSKDRASLLAQAVDLGCKRYLARWLELFDGLSRRGAWKLYTGGEGYPALGTFYLHVKHSGNVRAYMEWCFRNELSKALQILNVSDIEIVELLARRDRIAEYREPHPWQ